MKEYRCKKCHKLLCRYSNGYDFQVPIGNINTNGLDENLDPACLEIKCSKCKTVNVYGNKEVVVGK